MRESADIRRFYFVDCVRKIAIGLSSGVVAISGMLLVITVDSASEAAKDISHGDFARLFGMIMFAVASGVSLHSFQAASKTLRELRHSLLDLIVEVGESKEDC